MRVGEAVLAIVADTAGFDRAVRGLGKNMGPAAEQASRSFSERFASGMESAGQRAGVFLRRGILAVAAGIGAVVGRALVGGFRRMRTIEDATAAMTVQLGSADKAARLLAATLKVVQGTPFNLDQFTEAASRLVSANIEIEKIPRILTAVGEAAAASGKGAEGVDRVVESLGRMATGATISLREVRSLEAVGVPALRILANQAGVSAEDMRKRISAGAVGSKEAIDDLVEGIISGTEGAAGATAALGGSMEKLREQTSGSLGGIGAALDRFGERILTVFRDAGDSGNNFARIFGGISKTIDVLTEGIGKRLESLAEGPQLEAVVSFFEKLPERVERALAGGAGGEGLARGFLDTLVSGFEKIPIATLAEALVRLFTRATVALATVAGQIATILTFELVKAAPAIAMGFIRGLMQAFAANPLQVGALIVALGLPGIGVGIGAFLGAMFKPIPIVGPILEKMILGLTWVAQRIVPIGGRLIGGAMTKIFGPKMIPRLGFVLANAFKGIGPAIAAAFSGPVILGAIAAAISLLGTFLITKLTELPFLIQHALTMTFGLLGGLIVGLLIRHFGEPIRDFFTQALPRFFTQMIPAAFSALVSGIGAFLAGVDWVKVFLLAFPPTLLFIVASHIIVALVQGFQAALPVVVDFFTSLPGVLAGAAVSLVGLLRDLGASALQAMWDGITTAAVAVFSFFTELPGRVMGFIASLPGMMLGFGITILTALLNGIRTGWTAVANWFSQLPGAIGRFFANAGSWLINAGKRIIDGLVSGIRSGAGRIKSALLSLLPGPIQKFADQIGISSPSKVFMRFGEQMVEGLVKGIEDERGSLERTMLRLVPDSIPMPQLRGGGLGSFPVPTPGEFGLAPTPSIVQNITIPHEMPTEEAAARAVAARLGRAIAR